MYDFLIVGSGLFGAVCANSLKQKGCKVLVIEKRPHVAGNCYTERVEGIDVHTYGPHIFHTNSTKIWEYVKQYSEFNNFIYTPKAYNRGSLYSLPINLMTLHQVYGCRTPLEAKIKLEEVTVKLKEPKNLEEFCMSKIGPDLYRLLIRDYTIKQWKKDPKELPIDIIKRIPIRFTFDENYYNDKYQGIPIEGYTSIIEQLLKGTDVHLNTDYFTDRARYNRLATKIIYTGPIDEYFDYEYGELEYRTNNFETQILDMEDFQGNAAINYCDMDHPYTRIIEHKHFLKIKDNKKTIITKDYPIEWSKDKTPMYPINDAKNDKIYSQYKQLSFLEKNVIFGGRLGTYKYLDMDQVINSALVLCKSL